MLEFLDQYEILIVLLGGAVAEILFRLIPSERPRSLLRQIITLASRIVDLLDRIIPDRKNK